MKFMLLIHINQPSWDGLTPEDLARLRVAHGTMIAELTASGELIETNELGQTGSRVVRTRDGVPLVTDGPFTEGKEIAGGYYIIDCNDMARATAIAARFVEAEFAPVDVRRIGS
ncbi:MAG: YciI family protein [Specibacter sp.]